MEKERKNYFIKLPTDFFKEDKIDWLLSQPEGCEYVIIFQMLVTGTANSHGLLAQKIGETKIMPFTAEKIRRDTAYFSLETIEKALELYRELDLISIREDGAMELNNYDRYVGAVKVSTDDYRKANAERQKRYREKKKAEKNIALNSGVTLRCNVTDNVTDNITDNVTNNVTDNVTDNITGNVTNNVTDNVTDNVTVTHSVTPDESPESETSTESKADEIMPFAKVDASNEVKKVKKPDFTSKNSEIANDNVTNNVTRNVTSNVTVTQKSNVTHNVTDNVTRNDRYRYRDIDINKIDDDRVGEIPPKKDKYNLIPKKEEDYQALVDEMLSVDPFQRPDLKTSVEEEKGLIDEMFKSFDAQKVIRAMKKGKDNRAKSFTYARQILQKQGDASKKPIKESNEKLVIPCTTWDEMLRSVNSDARKDILEETPEGFRNQVLLKTSFYSCVEITDALRMARLDLEQSFEGNEDEKVYAYFSFLLRYQGTLSKEAIANDVDPQSYILKKFSLLWEKQQE